MYGDIVSLFMTMVIRIACKYHNYNYKENKGGEWDFYTQNIFYYFYYYIN